MTTTEPAASAPVEACLERPLRADARRNRERILAGAREVFAESGADAQMDDVAARAGVGVGTVYRHFPTKEALFAALVRDKFRAFVELARAAQDSDDGEPFGALSEVLRRQAQICASDAALQNAMTGAGDSLWRDAEAEITELIATMQTLVTRAQQAGEMREGVTASDLGMFMCGISSTMGHPAPGFDWRRHLELVISMLQA